MLILNDLYGRLYKTIGRQLANGRRTSDGFIRFSFEQLDLDCNSIAIPHADRHPGLALGVIRQIYGRLPRLIPTRSKASAAPLFSGNCKSAIKSDKIVSDAVRPGLSLSLSLSLSQPFSFSLRIGQRPVTLEDGVINFALRTRLGTRPMQTPPSHWEGR